MPPGKSLQIKKTSQYSVEPVFITFFKNKQLDSYAIEEINLKAGETARFKRQNQEGFYLVKSGLTKMELKTPQVRILRLCSAGDLVGFGLWKFSNSERYQMTSIRNSVVQFWNRKTFEKLQADYPEINDLISEHLCKIIAHKDERIAALEGSTVKERVIFLLLWLVKNFGKKTDNGLLIDINLDRDSMAQLAGTVPATLARTLSELEDENLIRRRRRNILVIDGVSLEKQV